MRRLTVIVVCAAMILSSCGIVKPIPTETANTSGNPSAPTTDVPKTEDVVTSPATSDEPAISGSTGDAPAEEPEISTDGASSTDGEPASSEPPASNTTEPPASSEIPPESTTEPPISSEIEPTPATEPPATDVTANGFKIEVIDGITYIDGVLVVNKTYALPATYAPDMPNGLTVEAYDAYARMYSAAMAEGLTFRVLSGYRSYYDQRWIYNDYLNYDPIELVDTYSARPGHSEHQSGMAVDLCSLSQAFGQTAEGIWLAEHAHEYGYILRYPAGKEHITGYKYEPWHFRYVGVDLATHLADTGLTLEEYFGITSAYQGPYIQ